MKTVILDMYGVIIKDPKGRLMPFLSRTFSDLLEEDMKRIWVKAAVGEMSSLAFLKQIGYSGDVKRIQTEYLDTVEIDGGFHRSAALLKERYRLALLSNDLSEWNAYLREKFNINQYFDAIVVSGDVRIKKPDPEIFTLLLERLNQPASQCVFIDDRESNLDAAEALGMDVILFNSRKVPYDGKIVNNFDELLNLLLPQLENRYDKP